VLITPFELAEKIQWHCDEIKKLMPHLDGLGPRYERGTRNKLHNAHLSLGSAAREIIHGLEDH
jgi:hypothetical protein